VKKYYETYLLKNKDNKDILESEQFIYGTIKLYKKINYMSDFNLKLIKKY
jgi:hypothetical protein